MLKKMAFFITLALILSCLPARGQDLFTVRIICPDNYDFRMTYAQMIVNEFSSVGINAVLDYLDFDEVDERCFESGGKLHRDGGFDAAFFGWRIVENKGTPTVHMDYEALYAMFHSDKSVSTSSGGNCMSWKNAKNDDLIDKIGEEDEAKLSEYWMEWQELFHEEQPAVLLYHVYREVDGERNWAFEHLAFNLNHPAFKNKKVRQALSHLVPREKICTLHNRTEKNQRPGTLSSAEPCAVPVNPDHFAFNDIAPYAYDIDAARELLFKAGYTIKTKKHENAESLLEQADEAFNLYELEKALDLVNQAKLIYEELRETEALSNITDTLIPLYEKAINAETLLKEGMTLKNNEDYEEAEQKLSEAQQIFEECELTQKVSETEALLSEIDEILRKQAIILEADSLFQQGKDAFGNEDYETALDFFKRARDLYVSSESEKATECDEWIQKAETELEKPCLGTIILVAFIGVGLVLKRS